MPNMKKSSILEFKLLKVENEKYFVKFSHLEIPVEMNEYFYTQLSSNNSLKGKSSTQQAIIH